MIPPTMTAVLLTGHGGLDKLCVRDNVPVPTPGAGQVLIHVRAAGVNNTDINTRIGWYSKSVVTSTNSAAKDENWQDNENSSELQKDGRWSGTPLSFPLIQGADVCGHIVAVGDGVNPRRIGQRVLVRSLQSRLSSDGKRMECWTFGSECNGGFAEYTVTEDSEAFAIESNLTDVELASFPCAYSTAENMLQRANVTGPGVRVFIAGASGGVGSAMIQLAKRRGATVIASCGSDAKAAQLQSLGADQVVNRNQDLIQTVGKDSVDVVIDLVAGDQFPFLLDILCPGGKYVVAGAIAGPMVNLDFRTLYLKDLTFFGCTNQDPAVFGNLVRYIEQNEIKPVVSNVFPLADIAEAQKTFLEKKFIGKIVLSVSSS